MCGRTLLLAANVPDHYKTILLPYAVKYAYMTRRLEVIDIDSTTSTWYKHLCGKLPKFVNYMHPFGEVGMVKDCLENSPKSQERGVTCMFVGYNLMSCGDCAVLDDPTNCFQRYKSRNIIGLS